MVSLRQIWGHCSCLAEQQDFPLGPADSFDVWDSSGLPDFTLSLLVLGSEKTQVKC